MKYKIFGEWKIEVEADSYQDATKKALDKLPDGCYATGFER